jgi:hypothetical protein
LQTSHFGLHDTALAYFVLTTPALNPAQPGSRNGLDECAGRHKCRQQSLTGPTASRGAERRVCAWNANPSRREPDAPINHICARL